MHVKFQIKMLAKNVIPTARSNDLGMRLGLEWLLYKKTHIRTSMYVTNYKHTRIDVALFSGLDSIHHSQYEINAEFRTTSDKHCGALD